MNFKVDEYIENLAQWKSEFELLRSLVSQSELKEEFKWKAPCYTLNGKNVLMIANFKDFCSLSFFKGALISDPEGRLEFPGENSQSVKLMKFNAISQIKKESGLIKSFISDAIEIEKRGIKIEKVKDHPIPQDIKLALESDLELNKAFNALTPGRQRGYVLHFSSAKQHATKLARIAKYKQRILDGKGIHDCVCGLSKKMPSCDGSHKSIKS